MVGTLARFLATTRARAFAPARGGGHHGEVEDTAQVPAGREPGLSGGGVADREGRGRKAPVWVVDLDGVVWLAGEPIEGAGEAVARLLARGRRVIFASNNSDPRREDYAIRLERAGIDARGVELLTAADAAALLVGKGDRVLALGGRGLSEALEAAGAEVLEPSGDLRAPAPEGIAAVVVGWDRRFDFTRMAVAQRAVRAGARLIGTNEDATHPTPYGLVPGTGAFVAAVSAAAESPPVIAGKPHDPMLQLLAIAIGAESDVEVVAGDRPVTDGVLAARLGAPFGFVVSEVAASDLRAPGSRRGPRRGEEDSSGQVPWEAAWEAGSLLELVEMVTGAA